MLLFSEIALSKEESVQERPALLSMSTEDESLPEHPMERPMPAEEEAEIEALEDEKREEE